MYVGFIYTYAIEDSFTFFQMLTWCSNRELYPK